MNNSRLQSAQMPEDYAAKMRAARKQRAMRGERRIITMLFCDVVGSTEMAGQLDPEEWAEIMNEAFEYLITPIYRYEGTVARLLGDAVLAFFGAPIAHEDDPQRAILAGLAIVEGIQSFAAEIRQDYGLDFNVRVGINTGPVVVGDVGTDLALEYTAMGDAINLASRMESTAEPGTVQITDYTYQIVAPIFNVRDVGTIAVKGKDDPVQAYCVQSLKAQPGRLRGISGIKTAMIGRSQELAVLKQFVNNLQHGQGQIVCLTGEAGLGKSRLIAELKSAYTTEINQEKIGWVEGHGISFDSSRPYSVIMQMLRQLSGVSWGDSPTIARQKIRARIDSFNPDVREPMARALEMVLTIQDETAQPALEGEALKRELFTAFLATWHETAVRYPMVAVYDDLHWADPASIELLLHLFQLVESTPTVFICSFRQYRQSPVNQLPEEAAQKYPAHFTPIELKPLASEEGTEMVNSLMAIADFPQSLTNRILDKADGNPFFIEEVLRALIDNGQITQDERGLRWQSNIDVAQIEIPNNVLSLLVSRIDRLEKDSKQTLQIASVIGRSFYERVLATISDQTTALDDQLDELQIMDIILREEGLAEPGYMFRHALTRDAAYNSILRRQRRRYHRRIAEAMQQLFIHNQQEEAHRLAYHFHEAGDLDQALHYFIIAGDQAARLYANTEAIELYGRALALAVNSGSDNQLVYLYKTRGRTYEVSGRYEEALADYHALKAAAFERSSKSMELEALLAEATLRSTFTDQYDPQLGQALLREALTLAESLEDLRAQSKIYWNLMLQGTYAKVTPQDIVAYGEQAAAIARQDNFHEELAYALHDLARPYTQIGQMDKAAAALEEAGQLWRELGNKPMLADNRATLASGYRYLGRLHQGLELVEEALQISLEIGSFWGEAYSLNISGPFYMELGRIDDALDAWQRSIPAAVKANFIGGQTFVRLDLGLAYAYTGAYEQGMALIEHVITIMKDKEQHRLVLYPLLAQARIYLYQNNIEAAAKILEMANPHAEMLQADLVTSNLYLTVASLVGFAAGDHEAVFTQLDTAMANVEGMGMLVPWLELAQLKGRGLAEINRVEEAATVLEKAYLIARQIGSQKLLWQILDALSQLAAAQGHLEKAATLHQESRSVIDFIAGHISDPNLKSTFLKSRLVQDLPVD